VELLILIVGTEEPINLRNIIPTYAEEEGNPGVVSQVVT
jgi:hypothetical protein